ncbi:MAG: RnfABCDGE type electron transport complex subunit B [Candidatus Limivivens sp.]|nr:RnfABCDGE type electron transport complex subunit B [Candidatus Limivivens sp.]
MITGIICAALVVGGTGLLLGLFLGAADKKFKVEVDEKELAVREALPGNNCGGCGYAGCDAMAKAIAKGEAPVNGCPVGGAAVAEKIGAIMGQEAGSGRRMVAFVKCAGDCEKTTQRYEYHGTKDCEMMPFVPAGGPKSCSFGCTGYGTCVKACKFDAIHVVNGIAVVDKEKCVACGQCVSHCPKKLIELVPYDLEHLVQCSSRDKGKQVLQACKAGCIGCKKCEKNCPAQAITVTDNVAHVDTEKCSNCGACAAECPRKIITNIPEKKN